MGVSPPIAAIGIAASGTLFVYNIDRLRDLEQDFATTPLRSAFIVRHARAVAALTVVSAVAAAGFAAVLGWRALLLLLPALVLGLLHRRLKRVPYAKPAYITTAWLVVVVGLPASLAPSVAHAIPVAAVLGLSIAANVIASNLRDRESHSPRAALHIARGLATAGVIAALLSPDPVTPLVGVPALTFAALLRRRLTERYGLLVVDGALLVGAAIAIAWVP